MDGKHQLEWSPVVTHTALDMCTLDAYKIKDFFLKQEHSILVTTVHTLCGSVIYYTIILLWLLPKGSGLLPKVMYYIRQAYNRLETH